jgi:hypothetical protein
MESSSPITYVLYKSPTPNSWLIDREVNDKSIRVCTISNEKIARYILDLLTHGEEFYVGSKHNGNVPWDS